ncbi:AraC family transcriptional regulator [Paraglaciecola aquimarina]|uniref:AraC family transcriptional regulator n=1 Tax=Paraglaciecola aquimarina TaxID=1235557 RepID=A0ABU3SYP7_9ALTE|nr:AraC family transcriptional regulator [Paraglaciecola aquimarina]MDU0355126.1 AraC family transcriptional regulator [Paraglaciecola aquimarina]
MKFDYVLCIIDFYPLSDYKIMNPDKYETGSGGFVWENLMPDEVFSHTQFHVYAAFSMQMGEEWAGSEFINHYNRLYYVRSGEGVLQFKDKKITLKAGHMYLIPAYQLVSHYCIGKIDFTWVHFQARIDAGLDLFMLYGEALSLDCNLLPHIENDFLALVELCKSDSPRSTFSRTKLLLSLLDPAMEAFEKSNEGLHSFRHQSLLPALTMINENVVNAPDVKEMAEAANFTPEHFSRKFKAAFNISPKRYILQKRIALAKQKLLLANVNVEQIAEQCGFCDIFYFSRVFKQEIGLSPSAFRKEYLLANK